MKRILVLAALVAGAFATTGGVASAKVNAFVIGDAKQNQLDGAFAVVNEEGEQVEESRFAAFSVRYSCSAGEKIGALFSVDQGENTDGAGGFTRGCKGGPQYRFVAVRANPGDPPFTDEENLFAEGLGITNANTPVNDVHFSQKTLEPLPETPIDPILELLDDFLPIPDLPSLPRLGGAR